MIRFLAEEAKQSPAADLVKVVNKRRRATLGERHGSSEVLCIRNMDAVVAVRHENSEKQLRSSTSDALGYLQYDPRRV